MTALGCEERGGTGGRNGGATRWAGLLFVLVFLFSGDLVRIHGHADGAPAAADCAACVAGLGSAVETDPPLALDPPAPTTLVDLGPAPTCPPALEFVRQGGLRDPPALLA